MRINTLQLTNVRGFTHAELQFKQGFNLIVGINGVGKTTVLDSLRIVLSHILTKTKSPEITKESFKKKDININTNQLQLNTGFTVDNIDYDFIYSKSSKDFYIKEVESNTSQNKELRRQKDSIDRSIEKFIGKKDLDDNDLKDKTKINLIPSRQEGVNLEDIIEFKPDLLSLNSKPLIGLFYSTRRSLIINQTQKVAKSKFYYAAAFVDALSENRNFNVKMFAEWYNVRQTLAEENPDNIKYNRVIELIQDTIYLFLPEFSNLGLAKDEISGELTFCITKAEKVLNFTQLSDGERGILALVFDIARRLIIANIREENPLHGQAVILIDELDLHLHPKWQRTIVGDLERTFPNCQFIATTHSPQIISSVLPENIQIIKNFEVDQTVKSFGLDINWILKFIMEDSDRLKESDEAIAAVQKLIDDIEFEEARALIEKYKVDNLDLSEWITFEAQMSHLELFEDEEDN